MPPPRRFVLLDRDGTVIVERHYLADPAQVELCAGAAKGLRRLRELGFGLVLVTNQSGVARGYFDMATVDRVHARLRGMLDGQGVALDGIYVCPHGPDDACDCRKPLPGLVRQAAAELRFDPTESFVIGDRAADIGLARAVGAAALLVRTGYGAEAERAGDCTPDAVVDDLEAAAAWIERSVGEASR